MCLQWCHVRSWLIDNDLPCAGCDRGDPQRLPSAWSCADCAHGIERAGQAICSLTGAAQPLAGRCCHWQAARNAAARLEIGDGQLAPWLRGSAGELFATLPGAPPISRTAGGWAVTLGDLSVPLVYGVPAPEWDAALGWVAAAPADWGTPLDRAQRLIIAALEALEQGAPELEGKLGQLAVALGPAGAAALAAGWCDIYLRLIALGRELYGAQPAIAARLDELERAVCISH